MKPLFVSMCVILLPLLSGCSGMMEVKEANNFDVSSGKIHYINPYYAGDYYIAEYYIQDMNRGYCSDGYCYRGK